ncbi:hypothetical protein [Moorena sp. SIOASIH]|uniref:hypothetical protein n=1 Tax=Moorena sp. SIOASIH TaxID=2607817 RepID=UPI0025E71295|nr:hypothetical protein [Moorena sp. SIOASIH]
MPIPRQDAHSTGATQGRFTRPRRRAPTLKIILLFSNAGFFPYSLLPIPYSLLPVPYSLFPVPCSLFPFPFPKTTFNTTVWIAKLDIIF